MQGAQILRNEAYREVRCNDEGCSATHPLALLRAVSPWALLRTVSLSNSLSNGRWTFYEALIHRYHIPFMGIMEGIRTPPLSPH